MNRREFIAFIAAATGWPPTMQVAADDVIE